MMILIFNKKQMGTTNKFGNDYRTIDGWALELVVADLNSVPCGGLNGRIRNEIFRCEQGDILVKRERVNEH